MHTKTKGKKIVLTVINDINYDQRMIRICNALHNAGYQVLLIGKERPDSQPLIPQAFDTKRIRVKPMQGKKMYALYWIQLFFCLLKTKADIFCATDLDSIIPIYYASKWRRKKRVYDGHELFTEMKEVITRPREKKMWDWIEKKYLPQFPHGYTIGEAYSEYFHEKYGLSYQVVRNATQCTHLQRIPTQEKFILYQGAVNEGRCFEQLLPAMQWVRHPLIICGKGNFFEQAKSIVKQLKLEEKVTFMGYIPPQQLKEFTLKAQVGITLFDGISLSNELSMANRYFDYMHAQVPQLCMNFIEYRRVNRQFEIAYLIDAPPSTKEIATALNRLMEDTEYHQRLQDNCQKARAVYNWENEVKTLLKFYDDLLNH